MTFDELVTSRKAWIDEVLQPWCKNATRKELLQAEGDWQNIAGRVDPAGTLWTWAWSRFPVLVHDELPGLQETHAVRVSLNDGTTAIGFPDARETERGLLVLIPVDVSDGSLLGPFSIDDVADVIILE
ncbi:hypothetical protein [Calycomorphotria hydatis]|uniref:Uncharacterized protein n=1 Tax=Calycomorphotria hydatis TaxID=2528027 RepID=A0A517TDT4_9PLAN|nr:hypothetical protein [Calycomorphotria hydatis]QDT66527.1 hypothetical protein V22_37970 [Calycomorphotria hydatis]